MSIGLAPKTWVAVVDVLAGAFLVVYVLRAVRRPVDPKRADGMIERMSRVASSPADARGWLERHARTVAAAILILLAAVLLRDGIAGLTA